MNDLDYIKEKYPRDKSEYIWACDYQPLYERLGEVVLVDSTDGYQGDDFVVLRKDSKLGTLVVGWGSCSGCDALQACSSHEEVVEVLDELRRSVVWHDDLARVLDWVDARDELNSFYYKDHDWGRVKSELEAKLG